MTTSEESVEHRYCGLFAQSSQPKLGHPKGLYSGILFNIGGPGLFLEVASAQ